MINVDNVGFGFKDYEYEGHSLYFVPWSLGSLLAPMGILGISADDDNVGISPFLLMQLLMKFL